MNIAIYSARDRDSRSGNWVTASRWQRLLRSAGHKASIFHDANEIDGCQAKVLIGLHARRSSRAILRFKRLYPNRKAIVALTGTDLYRDLSPTRKRHPALAIEALEQCDHIIVLQPLMTKRLKPGWKKKSSLVMMDVPKGKRKNRVAANHPLRVCVVGHMRNEKDSFRAAMSVRNLPAGTIEVTHVGKALTESLQQRAARESKLNPNWNWLGSVTYDRVQRLLKSSDVLVNSSRIEGAPNVLFEAIHWRLPIIASKIDGHVGVLGNDYGGYFKVGDTDQLGKLLLRCQRHPDFYCQLLDSMEQLAKKYKPGNELRALLKSIRVRGGI